MELEEAIHSNSSRSGSFEISLDTTSIGDDEAIIKFGLILEAPSIDMQKLQRYSWRGIPPIHRPLAWKLLIGYLPNQRNRHEAVLERKRREYHQIVADHFNNNDPPRDHQTMHQIAIDVPRTAPSEPLFRNQSVREAMARILYCWSIRRPASGYVQGINDLVTPLLHTFLSVHHQHQPQQENQQNTIICVTETELAQVEADVFWCFSRLLDSIQDNYTASQVGISRNLTLLQTIINRVDPSLSEHLQREGCELVQFAFRWMNCLLMREFPLRLIVRLWDTYLAEDEGFSLYHTFVCAALLLHWSPTLQTMDFQQIILFLQSPPTEQWGEEEIELLLSQAYVFKSIFT